MGRTPVFQKGASDVGCQQAQWNRVGHKTAKGQPRVGEGSRLPNIAMPLFLHDEQTRSSQTTRNVGKASTRVVRTAKAWGPRAASMRRSKGMRSACLPAACPLFGLLGGRGSDVRPSGVLHPGCCCCGDTSSTPYRHLSFTVVLPWSPSLQVASVLFAHRFQLMWLYTIADETGAGKLTHEVPCPPPWLRGGGGTGQRAPSV